MGYRVIYGKTRKVRRNTTSKVNSQKSLIIWSIALLAAAFICLIGWSDPGFRQYLLPGDPRITETALDQLVVDIQNGESFSDAITTFCREIIDSASEE